PAGHAVPTRRPAAGPPGRVRRADPHPCPAPPPPRPPPRAARPRPPPPPPRPPPGAPPGPPGPPPQTRARPRPAAAGPPPAAPDGVGTGPGRLSLRQAVNLAALLPVVDTITFDPTVFGTTPQTITLSQGQLALIGRSTTTIIGPGAGLLTVSGGNNSRVFDI